MAYEPKEPSFGSRVANTAAETAKGAGLGLAATAAVLIGIPVIAFAAGSIAWGIGLTLVSALLAGPVLFGSAAVTGGLFGARRGMRQNELESAKAQSYEQGRAILAAQEAQLATAQNNFAQGTAPASYIMTPSQVREIPNNQVSNSNYQGQLQAADIQRGVAG